MKKFYFLFVCLVAFMSSKSQTVSVFTNLNISTSSVIGSGKYHVSESIYTDAELGSSNFITAGSAIQKVYFYLYIQGSNTTVNNYRISMKNVAAGTTTFTSGTYNTPTALGYTTVYSGSFTATPTGYVGVTLTTPFVRTPGTNLQVMLERTDNLTHTGYQFIESEGNSSDPAALSSRVYNGNASLNVGTTSLSPTISRPGMRFVHTYPNDAAIRNIISPAASCYDGTQTIGVQVYNAGSNSIPVGAAAVTLKLSGANPFTGTLTNTSAIAAGTSSIINFTDIDLSVPGDVIDTAYVNLTGESYRVNDTLISYTSTASVINAFPIVEDAESTPLPVFGYADPVVGSTQLWTRVSDYYTNDDMNPTTAPANTWDTIKPRATGNNFYLFDSYNGSSGSVSRLYSNCITLPTATPSPISTISFWMSKDSLFSTYFDSLFVSVSNDKGLTWTRILPGFRRTDIAAAAPYWKQEIVDLSAYNGQTIQIGFEGVSKYGNAFALDDININYTGLVPVSILSLNATRNGKVNNLHWSTSNQVNARKFIVERSNDGINFSSIGQVNAATTNNITEDYFFVDATPAKGINYYRIKMVDIDNSYKLSVVRNVKNLGVAELSVNPNPVLQTMRINIEAENTENAVLIVSDVTGKKLISKNIMVTAGTNNIEIPAGQLSKGTYVVAVRLSNQTLVQRISKM